MKILLMPRINPARQAGPARPSGGHSGAPAVRKELATPTPSRSPSSWTRLAIVLTALALLGSACRPAPPPPAELGPTALPPPPPSARAAALGASAAVRLGAIFNVGPDGGPVERSRSESAALAVELVNARGGVRTASDGRQALELVVYDDDGVPEWTALALRSLAEEDGVIAVVGPADPEAAAAAARASERVGVPLVALADLGGSAGDGAPWRWTFTLSARDDRAVAPLVESLQPARADRVAWIGPRTATAAAARATFDRLAGGSELRIVAEAVYDLDEQDLGDGMGRLAAVGAQHVIGWPRDASDAALLARAAAQRAPNARLYLGPAAATDGFLTLAGSAASGVRVLSSRLPVADDLWDHQPVTPAVRDFARAFALGFGRAPLPAGAAAWDAVRLTVDALERSATDRESLRRALEATRAFPGAAGEVTFDARHAGLDERAYVVALATPGGWRLAQ